MPLLTCGSENSKVLERCHPLKNIQRDAHQEVLEALEMQDCN